MAVKGGRESELEPEWPALHGYDPQTDDVKWRECSNLTTIKDYLRAVDGNQEKIGAAARELIAVPLKSASECAGYPPAILSASECAGYAARRKASLKLSKGR